MGTEDNLFYELKALHSISKEAKELYGELVTYEDEAKGKDILMICKDRMQVVDKMRKVATNHSVNWLDCRVKVGTEIIYFKTIDEVKKEGIIGYRFRRIIFN